jgi:hypothetical protein
MFFSHNKSATVFFNRLISTTVFFNRFISTAEQGHIPILYPISIIISNGTIQCFCFTELDQREGSGSISDRDDPTYPGSNLAMTDSG